MAVVIHTLAIDAVNHQLSTALKYPVNTTQTVFGIHRLPLNLQGFEGFDCLEVVIQRLDY